MKSAVGGLVGRKNVNHAKSSSLWAGKCPHFFVPAASIGNPIHLCIYLPGPGWNCDQQKFKERKNDLNTVLASKLAKMEQFKGFL